MREEIKISGFGGQGVITLGKMLINGTIYHRDLFAVQTSAYGVAARGGSCWTEVVVSDENIDYPRVKKPNYLILLSQDAAYEYGEEIRDGGTLLYDSSTVKELPRKEKITIYKLPATRIAKEELNSPLSANILILGFLTSLTRIFSKEVAHEVIRDNLPKDTVEDNIEAFNFGLSLNKSNQLQE